MKKDESLLKNKDATEMICEESIVLLFYFLNTPIYILPWL